MRNEVVRARLIVFLSTVRRAQREDWVRLSVLRLLHPFYSIECRIRQPKWYQALF